MIPVCVPSARDMYEGEGLMLGQLVPCGGGDPIPLLQSKLLIGRQSFCDVSISHARVSSRHCEMEFTDGYWVIRDLGSTNGTRVDGMSVDEQHVLPGAEIAFANQRFTIDYTPTANQPLGPQGPQPAMPSQSLLERAAVAVNDDNDQSAPSRSAEQANRGDWGQLVPCGGGIPFPLDKPRLTLGRHGRCDIVLRDPTISAKHCELELRDGYWYVQDLGSRNGVKVDGELCESRCLMPNCTLSMARLHFKVDYVPLTDEPPPDDGAPSLARSLLEKAGLLRRQTDSRE